MSNNKILSSEMAEEIRMDILLGGDTQLIGDDGLRFIVIEKNILPDFPDTWYYAFKFVYNKERVHVFSFHSEGEMLDFYNRHLNDEAFIRQENQDEMEQYSYYPPWVEAIKKHSLQKCQIVYEPRIREMQQIA
jgi:hypothetical protein